MLDISWIRSLRIDMLIYMLIMLDILNCWIYDIYCFENYYYAHDFPCWVFLTILRVFAYITCSI